MNFFNISHETRAAKKSDAQYSMQQLIKVSLLKKHVKQPVEKTKSFPRCFLAERAMSSPFIFKAMAHTV